MNQLKKRWLSGVMAVVLLLVNLLSPVTGYADESMRFNGNNIWQDGSEILFDQERHYLFRWMDTSGQTAFCIDPGNHMGFDVRVMGGHYKITDDEVPYIASEEDFKLLSLICDWYDKNGAKFATNGQYAAAQGAVWAVIAGEWDQVESYMTKINRHVKGTGSAWTSLKDWIENAYQGAKGLPEWCSFNQDDAPAQTMTLEDGVYTIHLDFSEKPEIAEVRWKLPDGWMQSISGKTLTLSYNGASMPTVLIEGDVPTSLKKIKKNSQSLTIYKPERTRDQAMIGAGLDTENYIYINIGGVTIPDRPMLDEPEPLKAGN